MKFLVEIPWNFLLKREKYCETISKFSLGDIENPKIYFFFSIFGCLENISPNKYKMNVWKLTDYKLSKQGNIKTHTRKPLTVCTELLSWRKFWKSNGEIYLFIPELLIYSTLHDWAFILVEKLKGSHILKSDKVSWHRPSKHNQMLS